MALKSETDEYYGPQFKLNQETNKYDPVPGYHKNLYGATFKNNDIATGEVAIDEGRVFYKAVDKNGYEYETEETPKINIENERLPEAVMSFVSNGKNTTAYAWKCDYNGIMALGDTQIDAQNNWLEACMKNGVNVIKKETAVSDYSKLNDDQRYFIDTFAFLIKNNEKISSAELAIRIKDTYDVKDQKTKLAVLTLKNINCNLSKNHRGVKLLLNCNYAVYRKNGKYSACSFDNNLNESGMVLMATCDSVKECEVAIKRLKEREKSHGL